MNTKSLLLAAATLAAGIFTSQAQTVYSANIVGYVNQSLPASQYSIVTPALAATSTNSAEDVLPGIQSGDEILLWTGSAYNSYTYLSPGNWIYPDGTTTGAAPNVGQGVAFFYYNSGSSIETNTLVGTVTLTNTVTLPGSAYTLVGSTPPISDSLDGTNLNLPLVTGDLVLLWDTPSSSYKTYTFLSVGNWIYPDGVTTGVAPTLSVGQGFFYYASGATETWTNNITVQ